MQVFEEIHKIKVCSYITLIFTYSLENKSYMSEENER